VKAPQQERSAAKVRALLAAARHLLQERPEEALTTRSVAAVAGVPVASLYRHFTDIDDLLDVVVHEHADAASAAVDAALALPSARASIGGAYEAVLEAHLELYAARPELTRIWRSAQLAARQAAVEAASDAALATRVAQHLVAHGIAPTWATTPAGARVLAIRTEAHWNAAGTLLGAALHAPPEAQAGLLADLRATVALLAERLPATPSAAS
jgi:AcrR family transcriptional regulator